MTFVCAWAGSLRVSEYSKNRYPHEKNHNLLPDSVYITSEGTGFEFKSDKTTTSASPVQHRFCPWGKLPPEAKEIMEEYMAARPKNLAEHFFCWEYSEQLTYSDVQNMIDTCLLHTEYSNIYITSHCFRSSRASMMTLDGTNYIDCARQGCWKLNSTAMESYTKRGLAMMTEPELLNKSEKYRKKWTQAHLKYITRYLIQTEGLRDSHDHFEVLMDHMFGYAIAATGPEKPSTTMEDCLPQISFPHPDCLGRDRCRNIKMLQNAKKCSDKMVADESRRVKRATQAQQYRDRAVLNVFGPLTRDQAMRFNKQQGIRKSNMHTFAPDHGQPQRQDAAGAQAFSSLAYLDLAVQWASSPKHTCPKPCPEVTLVEPPKTKREWPYDSSPDAELAKMQRDTTATEAEYPVLNWEKPQPGPVALAARPYFLHLIFNQPMFLTERGDYISAAQWRDTMPEVKLPQKSAQQMAKERLMDRLNRMLYTSVRNYQQTVKAATALKAKGLPQLPLPRRRRDNKWDIKLKNFFLDEVYVKGLQGLPQRVNFEITDKPTTRQFYERVLEYYNQKSPFYEADLCGNLGLNAHAGRYSDGSVFKKVLVRYGGKCPGNNDTEYEIPTCIRRAIAAEPPSRPTTRSQSQASSDSPDEPMSTDASDSDAEIPNI